MATIRYTFADGHSEEVEVTEEFKREYEFLLVREQALHWKEMKQKERAGFRCVKNLSLEKFGEDGYALPAEAPDPLERLIAKEEHREQYRKILSCLTEKQRQVYILFHIKGYKKVQKPIALFLQIPDEKETRHTLAAMVLLQAYKELVAKANTYYYPWDEEKLKLEYGDTPTYRIYQLKRENFDRLFTSYHSTVEQGYTVKADDYELAYIADNADGYDLDEIYEEFNIDRPDDFCGHSLSVGDVIAFKGKDGTEAYFVDSYGFEFLPDFFGAAQKKPAQM